MVNFLLIPQDIKLLELPKKQEEAKKVPSIREILKNTK